MLHVTDVPYVRNPICVFSLTCHDAQDFKNSETLLRNLLAHMPTVDQLSENSQAHTVFLKPTLLLSSPLHPVFSCSLSFTSSYQNFVPTLFFMFSPYILFIFVVSHSLTSYLIYSLTVRY